MLWYIYIYEKTLMKKKGATNGSKDLDNPTYDLFKKPGRYSFKPFKKLVVRFTRAIFWASEEVSTGISLRP
jgi:hypothetical protein